MFLLSFSFLFFYFISYDELIHAALNEIARPDLYDVVTQHYFTQDKFDLLKTASWFISVLFLAALVAYVRWRKSILNYFQKSTQGIFAHARAFKQSLFRNSREVNILLIVSLLAVLCRSIWYATTFYIQHDEAWNFNFFLQKNILFSLFAYNNYPLHNVVSWFVLQLLPISTFVLRLPSILTGLLCCMLVFVSVKKIFKSEWTAFGSMLIFACLPMSVFYMLYARGVIFEIFFALLICYLIYQYLQQKVTINKIVFLALLNALGVASMLSHVYFIAFSSAGILLYLIFQKEKQWHFIVLYSVLSVLFSLIFLSPMIFGSGISPGLNAGTADANYLVLHYLPFHCYADYSTGLWFGFYILIALNLLMFWKKEALQYRQLILINLVLLISPLIIRYTTGAWIPERALAFLIVVPVSTFAMVVTVFRIQRIVIISFSLVAAILLSIVVYQHPKLNWSKEKDRQVYQLASIMKAQNLKEIYNESNEFIYYIPGIQYYFLIDKKQILYGTSIAGSNRFQAEMPGTADCRIIASPISNVQPIFSSDSLFVYKLK